MTETVLSIVSLSDDADGYATSQTPGGAGNLTLAGALVTSGVGTADSAQPVTITSVADETARTFTITGTGSGNRPLTEAILGANAGAATTTEYFKTVTQIAVDDATTGAVTAGPIEANGAATPPCALNFRSDDFAVGLSGEISVGADLTWKVQNTMDNVHTSTDGEVWIDHSALVDKTVSATGNYQFRARACRGVLTAFVSGTFDLKILED